MTNSQVHLLRENLNKQAQENKLKTMAIFSKENLLKENMSTERYSLQIKIYKQEVLKIIFQKEKECLKVIMEIV